MRLPQRPIHRFCLFSLAWALLALAWPVCVYKELNACAFMPALLRHQVTFTIIHFTAFPFAIGWFAAKADRGILVLERGSQHRYWVLVLLWGVMLCVSYSDLTNGYLLTASLKNPCSKQHLQQQECQKKSSEGSSAPVVQPTTEMSGGKSVEEIEKGTFPAEGNCDDKNQFLMDRSRDGLFGTLRKGNSIVPASAIITVVFQLFAALVVWCSAFHILDAKSLMDAGQTSIVKSRTEYLAVTIVAMATWIPARSYTNYWEREYGLIPTTDAAPYFASLVAFIVLLGLLTKHFMLVWPGLSTAKYLLGLLCVGLGIILIAFDDVAKRVYKVLDSLHPSMIIAICFVGILIVLAVFWDDIRGSQNVEPQHVQADGIG